MLIIDSKNVQVFDTRRHVAIPGNNEATIRFAAAHWIQVANAAIEKHSRFAVALSGGSTPKAIFQTLSSFPFSTQVDWQKVWLFWSDERAVPPTHPDSNYHMAMNSGLQTLKIPQSQIFRMEAEHDTASQARQYEQILQKQLGSHLFDLVMLGIGEDGHTASLFPGTLATEEIHHLVAANYVSEKKSWRMTLTFPCINQSQLTVLYALGDAKKTIVNTVLHAPLESRWPASRIGTSDKKALWILDQNAAQKLL